MRRALGVLLIASPLVALAVALTIAYGLPQFEIAMLGVAAFYAAIYAGVTLLDPPTRGPRR